MGRRLWFVLARLARGTCVYTARHSWKLSLSRWANRIGRSEVGPFNSSERSGFFRAGCEVLQGPLVQDRVVPVLEEIPHPAESQTSKELTERPSPPIQVSKPASTSSNHQDLRMYR